jgi:hypothetical protein
MIHQILKRRRIFWQNMIAGIETINQSISVLAYIWCVS